MFWNLIRFLKKNIIFVINKKLYIWVLFALYKV